jgi:hypothetical protein
VVQSTVAEFAAVVTETPVILIWQTSVVNVASLVVAESPGATAEVI